MNIANKKKLNRLKPDGEMENNTGLKKRGGGRLRKRSDERGRSGRRRWLLRRARPYVNAGA
jgi:hypothetical protein